MSRVVGSEYRALDLNEGTGSANLAKMHRAQLTRRLTTGSSCRRAGNPWRVHGCARAPQLSRGVRKIRGTTPHRMVGGAPVLAVLRIISGALACRGNA